ncbi:MULTISPECIES: endonuclease/exonuclease/phosphatase family protein [unclassified Streptomyces]|uniref:endonuclease/exonuclease/phosphatase family protein n=1 Tax=unclassified Streptomyces TaxID=2593676 RepID=UPI000CD5B426|nr:MULTISPECIES: endonuclease/exonuclease/phosphatase family protein [unclassified Streptomyces]
MVPVRILTWNLWWRFGPWEERRKAILAVLREVRPDVIALQEVWSAGPDNLAALLADELELECVFAPAGVPPHWHGHTDPSVGVGNAVLSRWPIAESEVRALPDAGGPAEGRVALYTLIDAGAARVPLLTTHLHAVPTGSAVRVAQVSELARFIAEVRGRGDFPAVVTGDFNAEPDSDELRLFGGVKTAPVVPHQAMVDVWRHADPGQPWATWSAANPYIRHPMDVDTRIDYIHVGMRPLGAPGPFGVRSVRLAGDGPVDGVWPSDHLAVVADLISPLSP